MRPPDYDTLAAKYVNNWKQFDSFMLMTEDAEEFEGCAIVYTSNRDSSLLARCNAAVIAKRIGKLPGVSEFGASHWACGHVDGYRIRVYTKAGKITKAFKVWCDINAQLEDYPILDEDSYSEMVTDAIAEQADAEGIDLSTISEERYDALRDFVEE